MSLVRIYLRYTMPIWLVQLFTSWLPDHRLILKLRGWLAHRFIKRRGKNSKLDRDVTSLNTYNREIGDNVYLAKGTWLNALGGLAIGDEVIIAPYVVISTMRHVLKDRFVRFGGSVPARVVIGRGSWLAAHASIKNEVAVGKVNMIAANAFVVKSTPDFVIMGGVPAVYIKNNEDSSVGGIVKSRKELLKKQDDADELGT